VTIRTEKLIYVWPDTLIDISNYECKTYVDGFTLIVIDKPQVILNHLSAAAVIPVRLIKIVHQILVMLCFPPRQPPHTNGYKLRPCVTVLKNDVPLFNPVYAVS
jgi:hypothetical protein